MRYSITVFNIRPSARCVKSASIISLNSSIDHTGIVILTTELLLAYSLNLESSGEEVTIINLGTLGRAHLVGTPLYTSCSCYQKFMSPFHCILHSMHRHYDIIHFFVTFANVNSSEKSIHGYPPLDTNPLEMLIFYYRFLKTQHPITKIIHYLVICKGFASCK